MCSKNVVGIRKNLSERRQDCDALFQATGGEKDGATNRHDKAHY
jgi:hypothetical protein